MFHAEHDDAALAFCEQTIQHDPSEALYHAQRGSIFKSRGEARRDRALLEEVVRNFDRAIACYPRYSRVYTDKAYSLFDLAPVQWTPRLCGASA